MTFTGGSIWAWSFLWRKVLNYWFNVFNMDKLGCILESCIFLEFCQFHLHDKFINVFKVWIWALFPFCIYIEGWVNRCAFKKILLLLSYIVNIYLLVSASSTSFFVSSWILDLLACMVFLLSREHPLEFPWIWVTGEILSVLCHWKYHFINFVLVGVFTRYGILGGSSIFSCSEASDKPFTKLEYSFSF